MSFEEFVARVDELVTQKNQSFSFAHTSAAPPEAQSGSRSATWAQPGGMVNLFEVKNRVRIQAMPIATEPSPTPLTTKAGRERFEAQQAHRFEYWVDRTEENAERVATDIARHLEGPQPS